MNEPLTYEQARELIEPLYQIIGAGIATVVVVFAVWLVLYPLLRKKIV